MLRSIRCCCTRIVVTLLAVVTVRMVMTYRLYMYVLIGLSTEILSFCFKDSPMFQSVDDTGQRTP
jgi:hypothetical protein